MEEGNYLALALKFCLEFFSLKAAFKKNLPKANSYIVVHLVHRPQFETLNRTFQKKILSLRIMIIIILFCLFFANLTVIYYL